MHIQPRSRLDRECPIGSSWYACSSSTFRGCCAVDPCESASCPFGDGTATGDQATTTNVQNQGSERLARTRRPAGMTRIFPVVVSSSSGSVGRTSSSVGLATTSSNVGLATSSSSSSSVSLATSSNSTPTDVFTLPMVGPTQQTTSAPPASDTLVVESPTGATGKAAGSAGTPGENEAYNGGGGGDGRPAGLSTGVVTAIVLASVLAAVVACALLWWCVCWRRQRRRGGGRLGRSRRLTWSSDPGGFGDDDGDGAGAAAAAASDDGDSRGMGYLAVIEARRSGAYAAAAAAATLPPPLPQPQRERRQHRRQQTPHHILDGSDTMTVPIGIHPCHVQPSGLVSRYEGPDDIRRGGAPPPADDVRSEAGSHLAVPSSPGSSSEWTRFGDSRAPTLAPSRQGSRKTTREAAAPAASAPPAAAAAAVSQPPQPPLSHQQGYPPRRLGSAPQFEPGGREAIPALPFPHGQRPYGGLGPQRNRAMERYHPAQLRPHQYPRVLRRPPKLARRALEPGAYPPDDPYQPRAAGAPALQHAHLRSLGRGAGTVDGQYRAVVGQYQQQQQQPPPPVYRRYQVRNVSHRDSFGDTRPRATLRATRREVETGVHAGSWSMLSPA